MDTYNKITKAIENLDEVHREAVREMYELRTLVKDLPSNSQELMQLLHELADAEKDCRSHGSRFPEETRKPYDCQSQECRDDWSHCYDRRENAVAVITRLAISLQSAVPRRNGEKSVA